MANLAIISSWPILATGRKCSFERLPYLLLNYFLISQELDLFSEKFFQIDEDREDPAPGMQMPSERASQPNEGNGGVKNLGTAKSASYENSKMKNKKTAKSASYENSKMKNKKTAKSASYENSKMKNKKLQSQPHM